ncbi:MAG: hypothetical protein KKC68_07935 [Candidatus Thermoplasmatota archaeon]|nr:hypothetical protein [Candidatus Thermoplasmatota archaeon]MBU1941687.1 hypothetical protein [Candidatus Thermoplasmatota archaeon]
MVVRYLSNYHVSLPVFDAMNPYLNPWFLLRILKAYLFDIDRLKRFSAQDLQHFQNKQIRKQLQFTLTVPVYQKLYTDAGISVDTVQSIEDINKLPYIGKHELKNAYPDGLVPPRISRRHLVEVATSGTTGKSLAIFVDQFDIVMGLFGYLRTLREYGLSWRRNRISIIGDFAPHTAESGYIRRGLEPRFKLGFLFKNIQWLDTNAQPTVVMDELNVFKPDFIGGYVGMLGHLALLKEQGKGEQVHPQVIASTGAVLDPQLKNFIEKSFGCPVFEAYGTTETGPIAYECHKGGYHVLSDLIHVEVETQGKPAPIGSPGHLIVTKLFGRGTPILRYTAINDIVALDPQPCTCGMPGVMIKRIYGRDDLSLLLPEGRVLLPATVAGIYSRVLYELKTTKLTDTRLVQHDEHTLQIQIVIDHSQDDIGPSVAMIKKVLLEGFQEKLGPAVTISVVEVDTLKDHERRIVTHVNPTDYIITGYV